MFEKKPRTIAILKPENGASRIHPDGEVNHLAFEAFSVSALKGHSWFFKETEVNSYTDILEGVEAGDYTYGIVPARRSDKSVVEEVTNFWLKKMGQKQMLTWVIAEEKIHYQPHPSRPPVPWHFHLVSKQRCKIPDHEPVKNVVLLVLDATTGTPEDFMAILRAVKATSIVLEPMHTPGKIGSSGFYLEYVVTDMKPDVMDYLWRKIITPNRLRIGRFRESEGVS